jgi:hypothetical protein
MNSDDNSVGTSKETLYVQHILNTLRDAQTAFVGSEGADKFLLYCAYLEAAILDDKTRAQVMIERAKEKDRLIKEGADDDMLKFHEAFITIKYVMKYLNDIMELEHHDIVGNVGQPDIEEEPEYDLFEEGVL